MKQNSYTFHPFPHLTTVFHKTKKKTAKKSGKEKASNAPDWAKRQKYDKNKSADSEAGRVLDEKYGKGKWRKGADSEFSKIKKWLQRDKGFK